MLPPLGASMPFAHTHAQQHQQLVEHMARASAASSGSHYLGTLLPTPGAAASALTLAPAAEHAAAAAAAGGRNSPSPLKNANHPGGDGAVVAQLHAGSLHSSDDTSDDSSGEDDVASAAAAALEAAVKQEQAFAGRSFAKSRGSRVRVVLGRGCRSGQARSESSFGETVKTGAWVTDGRCVRTDGRRRVR
jgi:hypothetical protein